MDKNKNNRNKKILKKRRKQKEKKKKEEKKKTGCLKVVSVGPCRRRILRTVILKLVYRKYIKQIPTLLSA